MATEPDPTKNPHHICTWQPVSACDRCTIGGDLKCRLNWGDQLHFMGIFLAFAIPAIIGMLVGGYGWWLLGWLFFALVNFTFWEARVLCSHCPFWAEEGRMLRCLANSGIPKVYRYHPEPMSKAEKAQLIIIFVILIGYPFPFLLLGGQFIFAFLAAWGALIFSWTLRRYTCSKCVNFSCPLNTVSGPVVEAYLNKNPVMRQAWHKTGNTGSGV